MPRFALYEGLADHLVIRYGRAPRYQRGQSATRIGAPWTAPSAPESRTAAPRRWRASRTRWRPNRKFMNVVASPARGLPENVRRQPGIRILAGGRQREEGKGRQDPGGVILSPNELKVCLFVATQLL